MASLWLALQILVREANCVAGEGSVDGAPLQRKLAVGQPFSAPTTTYLSSVQGSADSVLLHPKLVEGSHSGHFIPPRDVLGCHAVLLERATTAQTQFHDQKRP